MLNTVATDATWQDVALALIAAIPGAIAAGSSLRNGRRLDAHEYRSLELERKVDQIRARNGHSGRN